MFSGFLIALVGLALVIGGFVKILFGGLDGLIAVAIGAAMAAAGVDDSIIKPVSK